MVAGDGDADAAAARARAAVARSPLKRSTARSGLPCVGEGGLFHLGAEVACHAAYASAGVEVEGNGYAGYALHLNASIDQGDVSGGLTFESHVGGSLTGHAEYTSSVNATVELAKLFETPVEVPVGPVVVVIIFEGSVGLTLSGSVSSSTAFEAHGSVSYSGGCQTTGGCSSHKETSKGASLTGSDPEAADVRAALEVTVSGKVYGILGISIGSSEYVGARYTRCVAEAYLGAGLNIAVVAGMGVFSVTHGVEIPVGKIVLDREYLANCSYWTGALTYKVKLAYTYPSGNTERISSSSALTLVSDRWAPTGTYPLEGSGSGMQKSTEPNLCGNPQVSVTDTQTIHWDGAITSQDDDHRVSAEIGLRSGRDYVLNFSSWTSAEMPAEETDLAHGTDLAGNCFETTNHNHWDHWFYWIFGVFSPGDYANSDSLRFTIDQQGRSSGTATVPADGQGSPTYTFTWNLVKHCTQGGISCA